MKYRVSIWFDATEDHEAELIAADAVQAVRERGTKTGVQSQLAKTVTEEHIMAEPCRSHAQIGYHA